MDVDEDHLARIEARIKLLEEEVEHLKKQGSAVATDEAALRRCVLASLRGDMKPLERFVAAGGTIPRR